MSQSFFHLSPHADDEPDHICITRQELAYQEHLAYMDDLSKPEYDALLTEAVPLANALYRVINDQAGTEAGVSFGAIVEALHFVLARIDQEMNAPEADDCDA